MKIKYCDHYNVCVSFHSKGAIIGEPRNANKWKKLVLKNGLKSNKQTNKQASMLLESFTCSFFYRVMYVLCYISYLKQLQLLPSACVVAVKRNPALHYSIVIRFCSS